MFRKTQLISLFTLLISSVYLTGCDQKDKKYYMNNISEANEKNEICLESLATAFMNQDRAQFETIKNEGECISARNALKDHKAIEAKRRAEDLEKMKQLQAAAKKRAIEQKRASLFNSYHTLTWQQNITKYANSQCVTSRDPLVINSSECIAEEDYYREQVKIGIEDLNQYSLEEVEDKIGEYCAVDRREISPCAVLSLVYHEKSDRQILNYLDDFTRLTEDYNQCVDQLTNIKISRNTPANKKILTENLVKFYPCAQAKRAKETLNLGHDDFTQKLTAPMSSDEPSSVLN